MALLELKNYELKKKKLPTGAIVGHTSKTTSKIWIRVYREGLWHLLVSKTKLKGNLANLEQQTFLAFNAAHSQVIHLEHQFTEQTDQTHCFELTELSPQTRYYYYLIADDSITGVSRKTELGSNHDHYFHTAAASPQQLNFGFYSCHDPFSVATQSEGAWPLFKNVLSERQADFVIGGGDQVYCDTNRASSIQDLWVWLKNNKNSIISELSDENGVLMKDEIIEYFKNMYRIYYRIYWYFEDVLEVFQKFPQYMIWDDHEIMDGWGSLTKDERKAKLRHWLQDDEDEKNYQLVMLMFEAAAAVYYENQHVHNPSTPVDLKDLHQSQWDYGFMQGDCAFYMLDVRGHHDCEADAYRLLGQDQFDRFKSWLGSEDIQKSKAVFICSPVPIVHWNERFINTADFGSNKDDFMDEWGHKTNHDERNRLLNLLLSHSHETGQHVIVLSGDVHCASAFQISKQDEFPGAKLFNITSSAISRKPAPSIATAAMQKSAPIDKYPGGWFEQLYRFSGANNFLMLSASFEHDEPNIYATIYWAEGDESTAQKVLKL